MKTLTQSQPEAYRGTGRGSIEGSVLVETEAYVPEFEVRRQYPTDDYPAYVRLDETFSCLVLNRDGDTTCSIAYQNSSGRRSFVGQIKRLPEGYQVCNLNRNPLADNLILSTPEQAAMRVWEMDREATRKTNHADWKDCF